MVFPPLCAVVNCLRLIATLLLYKYGMFNKFSIDKPCLLHFQDIWLGIIHHVVDEHQWPVSFVDTGSNSCQHGPLCEERQKGWLTKGSPAHDALIEIVMNKRLINKIPYYLHCRYVLKIHG